MSTQFYVTFSTPKFNGNSFILNWELTVTRSGRCFTRWQRHYNRNAVPKHTWILRGKVLIVQPFKMQILSTFMSEKLPTEYTWNANCLLSIEHNSYSSFRYSHMFRPFSTIVWLSIQYCKFKVKNAWHIHIYIYIYRVYTKEWCGFKS